MTKSNENCEQDEDIKCNGCGMSLETGREYHPFLACTSFRFLESSTQVEANLRAIIEYAYKAKECGLTVEEAMRDVTLARSSE